MTFREATLSDIPALHTIRTSVRENVLSNPALITPHDYEIHLITKGKGWVCEIDGTLVGFSIVSLEDHNVWALFLFPACEGLGIGKRLHDLMIDWYFTQTTAPIWLSTEPNSRAEAFYRRNGWVEVGVYNGKEIKLEKSVEQWQRIKG